MHTCQWTAPASVYIEGGKFVENITQAWARDVLSGNMPAVEAEGYRIILGRSTTNC